MIRIVGMGKMIVSADPKDVFVTHALGSCLGLAIHDPVTRIGGLLHAQLPLMEHDPDRAGQYPAVFCDSGVTRLFHHCYELGARKEQLIVTAAGCGSPSGQQEGMFQIGKRNEAILRRLLLQNGVLLAHEELGGTRPRGMALFIANGDVTIKTNGEQKNLIPRSLVMTADDEKETWAWT